MATTIGSTIASFGDSYIPALSDTANIQTALQWLYFGSSATANTSNGVYGALKTLYDGSPTLTGPVTITGDLAVNGGDITTSSTGTATLFNTNATTLNIGGAATAITLGAITGTTTLRNTLKPRSGSTTAGTAPIQFTGGQTLGTPVAGVVEFDGRAFYTTPNATTGRGVSPSTHFYVLPSDRALTSTTSAQSIFGVGLPLAASTQYQYEMVIQFDYVPGSTGITVSDLFAYTGTLNSATATHQYSFNTASYATGTAVNHKFTSTITTGQSVASGSSATVYSVYTKRGIISTSSAGTLTPQLQMNLTTLLVTPPSIKANSYIKITPIGVSSSTVSVGAWA